nr:transglutaminase domain-containing protein [uncultured Solibaculum sp.]
MAFFVSPEETLYTALSSKQSFVRLEHCVGSLETVFKNAFKRDRRLIAIFSSYEANYMKKGLVQLSYDYDVTLHYQENGPNSLDDIMVDDAAWDAGSLLEKSGPKECAIVTDDPSGLQDKITRIFGCMMGRYEGIISWRINSFAFEKMSTDTVCFLTYDYVLPTVQLRQLQSKTAFAAKTIWKSILGRAQVPQFVKPFLALSYLSQECTYDQRAFDEVEDKPNQAPSDPIPHLAYGPLVEKRGICGGLAWAFKRLMDEAGIECICVSGYLKEDLHAGHMWDLVKLDGQYYHVDPTWGIKGSGVFIGGFMQPDAFMRNTHLWEEEHYPKARGMRFQYDFIEDYLAQNGGAFLDDGASETYMFPNDIVE